MCCFQAWKQESQQLRLALSSGQSHLGLCKAKGENKELFRHGWPQQMFVLTEPLQDSFLPFLFVSY